MSKQKIHSLYARPEKVYTFFSEPSMALQAAAADADINNIMAKYTSTGVLGDPFNPGTRPPQYGDFSTAADYHSAYNIILAAEEAFADLPSQLRKRFENDPAALLSFLEDIGNLDEAIALGLVPPRPGTVTPLDVTVPTDTDPKKEVN